MKQKPRYFITFPDAEQAPVQKLYEALNKKEKFVIINRDIKVYEIKKNRMVEVSPIKINIIKKKWWEFYK